MQKVKVIDKKSEQSIKYERELLSRLHHPFIVNMHYAFQDYDNLYLVLDLLLGGDLRYHVSRLRKFSEEQTRFFIACIILALEYIHSKRVIHRDIKPENLVFDDKGYVHITDFGIAKIFSSRNSNETSGTPGYMAPEVMRGQNHSHAVDFFAVGVIGYEFMLGRRPYIGKSRKEIKEQMMAKQAQIKPEDIPYGWSEESADFINNLLQRKPELRLGITGARELKEHPWLKYFPWNDLMNKKIISPFIPDKRDNYDKRYCEAVEKLGLDTKTRYEGYKNNPKYELLFENFTFYTNEIKEDNNKKEIRKYNSYNNISKETSTPRTASLRPKSRDISYESNQNSNTLRYARKTNLVDNNDKGDYRKKRSQSALNNPNQISPHHHNSSLNSPSNNNPVRRELRKSGSNSNIIVNRNTPNVSSKPSSPMNIKSNSHRPSSSIANYSSNNIMKETKNIIYHHQHIKSYVPKANSSRPSSNVGYQMNNNNDAVCHHYHHQSNLPISSNTSRPKIPIPSHKNYSNYDNYKPPLKNRTIEESLNRQYVNYNRNTPQSYRTKSNYKIGNNNSSSNFNTNSAIANQRKMSYVMQRPNSSYSYSRLNQSGSHSSFEITNPVSTQKNIININVNGNVGMVTLFKNYKMSSCSSHSTGASSNSKIIKN